MVGSFIHGIMRLECTSGPNKHRPYSSLWFCSLSCSHFCSLPSMSVPFLLRSLLLFLLPTFHFCTISTPYSTFFLLPTFHVITIYTPYSTLICAPNLCSQFVLP